MREEKNFILQPIFFSLPIGSLSNIGRRIDQCKVKNKKWKKQYVCFSAERIGAENN